MRRDAIRQVVQEHGTAGYLQYQADLLEGKTLPNGRRIKARPEDFSIKALWEALVGPVEDTLGYAMAAQGGYLEHPVALEESLTSSAFPSAVGQLIATRVIDRYNATGFVGDLLVETIPSRLRGERMVGFTSVQGPKVVVEGEAYQDASFGEKFVTTVETKRGRLLSVTEEAVFFDQTGQLLSIAGEIGDAARQDKERRIIRGVADVASTVPVYRPAGAAEQLYSSGNNNLLSTNTPLVDWTDIQEAWQYHVANIRDDRQADDSDTSGGQPIQWTPPIIILTAVELAGTASRIVNATQVGTPPGTTGQADMMTANPLVNMFGAGGVMAVASPFLDAAQGADQWDDASDWLIGNFRKQFKYKEIWPLQVFRAPAQNPEQFNRDVVATFKVREFGDINAVDERWVIKVNAAS